MQHDFRTNRQKTRTAEMARVMRECPDGFCTAEHLVLKGFTRHEIETLGPFATEEANAASSRRAA